MICLVKNYQGLTTRMRNTVHVTPESVNRVLGFAESVLNDPEAETFHFICTSEAVYQQFKNFEGRKGVLKTIEIQP